MRLIGILLKIPIVLLGSLALALVGALPRTPFDRKVAHEPTRFWRACIAVHTTIASRTKRRAIRKAIALAEQIPKSGSIKDIRQMLGKPPTVDLYRVGVGAWRESAYDIERRCFLDIGCSGTSGHVEQFAQSYFGPLFPFFFNTVSLTVYFERDADPLLAPYPDAPNGVIGWIVRDDISTGF